MIIALVQKSHKLVRDEKVTGFMGRRIWATTEIYENSGYPIPTVQCSHQSNLHIKRKLWGWTVSTPTRAIHF